MKGTKKTLAMILAVVLAVSLLAACGSSAAPGSAPATDSSAPAADAILWKMGAVDPESYFMTALTMEWGDAIEEASGGRIQTEMFASGSLGSDSDMLDSMDAGTLQIWEGGSNVACIINKAFDAWSMMYLYESDEQKYNFWDTHFDEVADMLAEETGYRILAVIDGPNRELTSTVPIESMADLKGFKIRVPEIQTYIDGWKSIGAAPTAMSFTEVYTSLQTKVISGQENDVLLCDSSGFFDVCKYLVMTDHAAYEGFVMITEDEWNKLPDDLKDVVRQCSKDLMVKSRDTVKTMVDECVAGLEARGDVTITYPDTAEFRQSVAGVYDAYPHIKTLVDMIRAS